MMLQNENKCWYKTRLHVAAASSYFKKITESNHNSEASPADFNSFYLYKIKNKLQFGIKRRFKAAVCKNFSYKQHFKKSQNISIKSQIKKLRCCETVKDRTND